MNRLLNAVLMFVSAASCVTWTSQCWAETKMLRVGIPAYSWESQSASLNPYFKEFEAALAQRGWIAGKNVVFEYRSPKSDTLQLTEPCEELVRLKVDVIFAASAPALHAAYAATRVIPIVAHDATTDPVAAGYAESYSRPGKNVTGVFLDAPEFAGKWLDILSSLVPNLKRIAVLWDPTPGSVHRRAVEDAALRMGVKARVYEVRKPEDIKHAFESMRKNSQAIVIVPSPMLVDQSKLLADLAKKAKLPATSLLRRFTEVGGAVSYGPSQAEAMQRLAVMVAKILEGAKPSDIPIERPTRFDFLYNMSTMKALNLKVPESLLLGAEMVGK